MGKRIHPMQARRWLLSTVLLVLPLLATARAEEGPHWEVSIEAAKRIAAQSNRLVLIHFWARWCGPCRNLEANVFKQPGVGPAMEAHFVPVKINVDVDDGHAIAHTYGVERLPTDVIITPTNRVLAKLSCPDNPAQYLAQLDQAATNAPGSQAAPNMVAQGSRNSTPLIENPYRSGAPVPPADPMAPQPGSMPPPAYGPAAYGPVAYGPGAVPPGVGGPGSNGPGMSGPGVGAPNIGAPAIGGPGMMGPAAAGPPGTPMQAAPIGPPGLPNASMASAQMNLPGSPAPAGPTDHWTGMHNPGEVVVNTAGPIGGMNPPQVPGPGSPQTLAMAGYLPTAAASRPPAKPTGLEGFCPVTLVERSRTAPQDPRCWIPGDARWGAVHRGMTYLFAGPEEQKRFLADPDRYSPVLSGNDPVLAFDRGQLQMGRREYGTFYDNRIYLFVSNETLEKFRQNARRYAEEVHQAETNGHGELR
jgi:thiol-disulfide isomerase/thioredoxin/YHS domain-containing protein